MKKKETAAELVTRHMSTLTRLTDLWPSLSVSAQQMLLKQVQLLVGEKYNGVMELHCTMGGVRLLRAPRDYRPTNGEGSRKDR